MNIDINESLDKGKSPLKGGNIYRYNKQGSAFYGSLYIMCKVSGKFMLFSLRDGNGWSSDTPFGSCSDNEFQDVTHLVKLTNV